MTGVQNRSDRAAEAVRSQEALRIGREDYDAVVFDLDGVITPTAVVHEASWRDLFTDFLCDRAARTGEELAPYSHADYRESIDGLPRYDGVRRFLASRGITLPDGDPSDPPELETVCGLGNRKNGYFIERLAQGVEPYPSSVALVDALDDAGIAVAIMSSSKNAVPVLEAAGLGGRFPVIVDGLVAAELGLPGKPDPALFVEAARRLGVSPARAVAVEDALPGVESGRRGGFALVVGVAREGHEQEYLARGAHVVVTDLEELTVSAPAVPVPRPIDQLPAVADCAAEIAARLEGRRLAVFLDYDGTLSPIVPDPDRAFLPEATRTAVARLSERCTVALVSGRDTAAVQAFVGLPQLVYAGSHGFDIVGPDWRTDEQGARFLPALDAAEAALRAGVASVEGAAVERKRFAIAVHYRAVAPERVAEVDAAVDRALASTDGLRRSGGKKVFELRPDVDWDKGAAVRYLLERLGLDGDDVLPVYLGDDVTDEDAFRALRTRPAGGLGIVVAGGEHPTLADYSVPDTDAVRDLLVRLADALPGPDRA